MVDKLSKEDSYFLEHGTELNDAPIPAADDEADEIEIADDDDGPAPAAKAADADPKPVKDAKDDKGDKTAPEKPAVPEGFVEKGAVDAERAKRKAAEKRAAEIERASGERFARLEERLRMMQEAPRQEADASAEPDFEADPLGYLRHVGQQVGELRNMTVAQRQAHEQQTQVQQAWNTVEQTYRADAQNFAAENPDFGDAYGYFSQSLARELGQHPKLRSNPAALQAAMRQEELRIADIALANGESPAEYIFGLAQARGWAKKAPEPAPTVDPNPKPKPKQTGAQQIERLAAAKDAATSLSSAGGAPGGNKISLEDLDRMTDEELRGFIKRKNAKDPNGYDKWMQRQMTA